MNKSIDAFLSDPKIMRQAAYIYSLAMGDPLPEKLSPAERQIERLLYTANPFERLYGEAEDACCRLCERLHPGVEEDGDVEQVWGNALQMCEFVALRMYAYGRYYALHPGEAPFDAE